MIVEVIVGAVFDQAVGDLIKIAAAAGGVDGVEAERQLDVIVTAGTDGSDLTDGRIVGEEGQKTRVVPFHGIFKDHVGLGQVGLRLGLVDRLEIIVGDDDGQRTLFGRIDRRADAGQRIDIGRLRRIRRAGR